LPYPLSNLAPVRSVRNELKIMIPPLVVIRGAGDLATGVAHRLHQSGFQVVMLELPKPLVVRRTVSFASAVYDGSATVETVEAKLCSSVDLIPVTLKSGKVPVLIDPQGEALQKMQPKIVIDAIMAKTGRTSLLTDAEYVIGLGPGFIAVKDVHAVVETKRGHTLGKVIYFGKAAADTAEPGLIEGYGKERLLRSPVDGIFKPLKEIGELIRAGETVASVNDQIIRAEIDGLIRGMLYPGLEVKEGMKVGDIDPRGSKIDYRAISDKARSIAGGVLEAIMHRYFLNNNADML